MADVTVHMTDVEYQAHSRREDRRIVIRWRIIYAVGWLVATGLFYIASRIP